MQIIEQDILDVKYGIIGHQAGLQGDMGAGLALQIKSRWPEVYNRYRKALRGRYLHLGAVQLINISHGLYVANLVGHDNYGMGVRHVDYRALASALSKLVLLRDGFTPPLPVYLPYKLGCGLAGGNWDVVEQIIMNTIPSAIICRKVRD